MMEDIRDIQMRNRCYCIALMTGTSAYTWYNYSLFEPLDNDFLMPYTLNAMCMLCYLTWDTYSMLASPVLFRTDLMIHHGICLVVFSSYIHSVPLQMSNYLLMESISMMNYLWKNNPSLLKLYRTVCIVCIRIPMIVWFTLYYNPNIGMPYLKSIYSPMVYNYLYNLERFHWFFIIYDIFILYKLYKPVKRQ